MWSERASTADDGRGRWTGWRGVVLIAATYVYFLIFAQFGFLKRLDELGIAGAHLKMVMAAMALGGIASSLLAARISAQRTPALRLRLALGGCAASASLTMLRLGTVSGIGVSMLIGCSLGLLTVTLVAHLDRYTNATEPLLTIGLGTGLGYFLCNIPLLFTATPRQIAFTGAAVCLLAGFAAAGGERAQGFVQATPDAATARSFPLVLAWLTALIWLDSAAFFIIQNSPALKSGTWEGAGHLWRTGALHLVGALVSVWLIRRAGVAVTLLCAYVGLGAACLALLTTGAAWSAAFLYPIGVSLYSVALVATPAFLLRTSSFSDRARKAGWIYAIAGWVGSAMGIGMGQNLHRVPPSFVAAAGVLFAVPWMWRLRRGGLLRAAAIPLSFAVALGLQHLWGGAAVNRELTDSQSQIDRGRGVYISEGCIHCHSQYVRPHSADVVMWGPTQDVAVIRREQPPLIGNRRQGPDLSEVGARRSPLWLRMHFIDPRDVSYESIMPAYAYLFHDDRGDALIAYISSLKTRESSEHLRSVASQWRPAPEVRNHPDPDRGADLFRYNCGTCHDGNGRARVRWATSFQRLPPNLGTDPLAYIAEPGTDSTWRTTQLERIIKFGLPGTNMPGHEYLSDADIEAIAASVASRRNVATSPASLQPRTPEIVDSYRRSNRSAATKR